MPAKCVCTQSLPVIYYTHTHKLLFLIDYTGGFVMYIHMGDAYRVYTEVPASSINNKTALIHLTFKYREVNIKHFVTLPNSNRKGVK